MQVAFDKEKKAHEATKLEMRDLSDGMYSNYILLFVIAY